MSRIFNNPKAVATPAKNTTSKPKANFFQAFSKLNLDHENPNKEEPEEESDAPGVSQEASSDLTQKATAPTPSAASTLSAQQVLGSKTSQDTALPPEDDEGWEVQKEKEKACTHELRPVYRLDKNGNIKVASNDVQFTDRGAAQAPQTGGTTSKKPKPRHRNQTRQTGRTHGGAHITFGINVETIAPGTFLWHWYVGVCYDPDAVTDESKNIYVFSSPNGMRMFQKGGYFMVIDVHEASWNECPMHTYNRAGISNKSADLKKGYVGVIPKHIKPANYKKQNDHPPIVVHSMKDKNGRLQETTVIKFTETNTSTFDTKVEIVGRASEESFKEFMELRRQFGVK